MAANPPSLSEIAALAGRPAHANMLTALLDGRALTASELAYAGGVAPHTTSEHLAKLKEGRLVALAKQGRHTYYRLASPLIGRMLESMMAVALDGPPRYQPRWRGGDRARSKAPPWRLTTRISSRSLKSEFKFRVPHCNLSTLKRRLSTAPAASASARKSWAVRSACRASRLVTRCNCSSSRSWSATGAERAARRHTDRAGGETARRLNQSSHSIGGKRDAAKGTAASAVR
jgi:DNA-binding transcriptional ArsR family regulator